jgi:hypothetical protein
MSVDLYHFKIVRIQTSKVHETFAPVNMGLWHLAFCGIFEGGRTYDHVCKKQKYKHRGQLKVKFNILLHGDNSWTTALRQMKFGVETHHGHTYKFYLNHHFVWQNIYVCQCCKFLRLWWDKHWSCLSVVYSSLMLVPHKTIHQITAQFFFTLHRNSYVGSKIWYSNLSTQSSKLKNTSHFCVSCWSSSFAAYT